jgi:hypothetical protein
MRRRTVAKFRSERSTKNPSFVGTVEVLDDQLVLHAVTERVLTVPELAVDQRHPETFRTEVLSCGVDPRLCCYYSSAGSSRTSKSTGQT